jgi:hypothetical protein
MKRKDNNKKRAVLVNVVIGDSTKKPRLQAGLFLTKKPLIFIMVSNPKPCYGIIF